MPFSKEDTWRVIRALRIPQAAESEIQARLDFTQEQSEYLVKQVKELLLDIEQGTQTRKLVSTEEVGLVKLDVIEYSEHRVCQVKDYQAELRKDLANLIGYNLQSSLSFPF